MPPLIAVSAGFPAYRDYMGQAYARPLEAVGALPVHLPYLEDPSAVLGVADGVVLGFGADIDPACYGGAAHPAMTPHSARRDAFELGLARASLSAGLPVLGICRGMQLLNVARGGTLLGDAAPHPGGDMGPLGARARGGARGHDPAGSPRASAAGGAGLAARGGGDGPGWVNSYHHQAVDALGEGVEAVAWADDGIVEALELRGGAWVLGVQWELQESWKDDERMRGVFAALVSATARRGARRAAA